MEGQQFVRQLVGMGCFYGDVYIVVFDGRISSCVIFSMDFLGKDLVSFFLYLLEM